MATSITNDTGSLVLNDGKIAFVSPFGSLSLEGEEFTLAFQEGGRDVTLSSDDFNLVETVANEKSITLRYVRDTLTVLVEYAAEEERFSKRVRLSSSVPFRVDDLVLEGRHILSLASLELGGEGLPFFANDLLYLGIEFPVADNAATGNALRCVEHPYQTVTEFVSLPVIYRLKEAGKTLSETFRADIEKRAIRQKDTPFSLIYGNWGLYDNMTPGDPVIDEALALRSIEDLRTFEKASGTKFSTYVMDSFWFEKGSHYASFDPKVFPRGFAALHEPLEQDALDLGLWFDVNFREDHPEDFPFEDNGLGNHTLCFGEEKVFATFRDSVLRKVKDEHLKAIKLDFAFFDCKNPRHDHAQGTTPSKEKAVKNFLRLVRDIRAIEPDFVFYCYNGFTRDLECLGSICHHTAPIVSPYWSALVDFVYCGDPRPAEAPSSSMAFSLACYTDAMVASFFDSYYPLASIDDHGTMVGNTGTIYYLGKETYRLGTLLDLVRGGKKLHLYGDLSLLDEGDRAYFGFLWTIAKDIDAKKMETSLAFGDSRENEVHGFLVRNATEGYLALLNPTGHLASPLFAPEGAEGSDVRFETLIQGGRLMRNGKTAFEKTTIDLGIEGYVLLRFRILETKEEPKEVLLRPGEKVEFEGRKGKNVLTLAFQKDGKPLRTPTGLPDCVSLVGAEPPTKPYWSGISWIRVPLEEKGRAILENKGEEDILVRQGYERKA